MFKGTALPLQGLEFHLELPIADSAPQVLLPEIGHGRINAPYLQTVVGLRLLVCERSQYRLTPAFVQVDTR